MLKTMLSVQISKDIIPEELKLEFEDLSKVNNKREYVDDSHRYYNSKTETLYIMNKYEDGFYNDPLLKEDTEGAAEHFFNKLQLDTSLQKTIQKSGSIVEFTLFTDISFCVGYNLAIDNPDFSNGYDLSWNWRDIYETGIVEAIIDVDDFSLSDYRDFFGVPFLSELGKDTIKDALMQAPYYGVFPDLGDTEMEDVIEALSLDLYADGMIDEYEEKLAANEDRWEDERW